MKKNLKFVATIVCAMILGATLNNFALSEVPKNFKIATVDVAKVVASSEKINILKAQQKIKVKELVAFVDSAKKEIDNEKDANKKKTLEDKYNKELNDKKNQIEKDYSQKLTDIDKEITKTIESLALKSNFDIVLTSNSVIYGGEDITKEVIRTIK